MRVLHATAYFAPAYAFGGPPRSLLALCQAQLAAGLDVEVYTTTANGAGELPPCPEGTRFEGVAVRYFPLEPPRRWLGAPGLGPALEQAGDSADVIHIHGLFNRTVWVAARAARRAGVPVVLSPRGMLQPAARRHHAWRKRLAWLLADRRVVAAAALLHATSAAERNTLGHVGPAARVVHIPNPVAVTEATPEGRRAARRAVGANAPFVLALGRLHPIKRLDLVLAAFARLSARHPDARLVIAGPDERGFRRRLEPLARPIGARVVWLPEVDGALKAGLLAEARALVQCSDGESFGMSIAEALGAGTPVVVTESCGWPEVAEAGAGLRVPQQADAVAQALDVLLVDEARARRMGAAGSRLIAREYAPAVVGPRWREVYAAVLDA